jgi:hypothetical protein
MDLEFEKSSQRCRGFSFPFPFVLQINLEDIGEIYKIRIGHDNSGKDPRWYLEEIRLENMATCELFCLTVDSWIPEDENSGDIWKEIPVVRTSTTPLPGI